MPSAVRALGKSALVSLLASAALAAPAGANLRFGSTGWLWGDPTPQGAALNGIAFAGATGYAAGATGTLLKTTDGGATWKSLRLGTFATMDAVQVLDANTLVASGACAARRSTDGGRTFTVLAATDDELDCTLDGISFTSATSGFAVQDDGTMLGTTDGGKTFTTLTPVPGTSADGGGAVPAALAFTSGPTGVVATSDGTPTGGRIYRTSDAGHTWQQVASGIGQVNELRFADASHAYAVGQGGLVLRSDDGGQTWAPKDLGAGTVTYTEVACATPQLCLLTATEADTASGTELVRTENGGDSAGVIVNPGDDDTTNAAAFASPSRVVVVGDGGTTDVSDDAGATFTPVDDATGAYTDVRAGARRGTAFALGIAGSLAKTTNSGRTWNGLTIGTSKTLVDLSFANGSTGFALDASGHLFRSTNGGSSWKKLSPGKGGKATGVAAPSAKVVVLIGAHGVRRSTQGGKRFAHVAGPGASARLSGFARARGGTLVAWGPGTLVRSTNGGASWSVVAKPGATPAERARQRIVRASFASASAGLVQDGRGRVWSTRDGGRSWHLLSAIGSEAITALALGSGRDAYVVTSRFGSGGVSAVLHSRDGGATWQPEYVDYDGSDGGVKIAAPGGRVDYAALTDDDGGLLATTSGGSAGARAKLTLTTKRRTLAKGATITVKGRLRGMRTNDQLVVSALAPGAKRWSHDDVDVGAGGAFSTTFRVRRGTTAFVAQWTGDAHAGGAGSQALIVTVKR